MSKIKFLLIVFFSLTAGGMLFPQDVMTRQIEDDSSLRLSLEASWFKETPQKVLSKQPEFHALRGGRRIQVRVETSAQNREEFAVVLAREQNGAFSGWAQGSWALIRRVDNDPSGARIRVFLRSDYNTYVQFRPFTDEKSYMDVVIYSGYVIRSLPIPIPFERLCVLPVEEALASAGSRFPRRYFEPSPGSYRDSRAFIAALRSRLPEVNFAEDGAFDEKGNYVYINSLKAQDNSSQPGLNCSGFAKWVVDGLLRPVTGERLPIAPLKAPFGERGSNLTELWEENRDPFFGLDWCRNLASRAGATLLSPSYASLEEIEVRDWPFSQVILRQNGVSSFLEYPGFQVNAGFGVEGLEPLLYSLAIDEPGHIYLAAVNNEIGAPITGDNPRGLPRFRQYYHIAVLVPYFSERGVFQIAVFESAEETSFNAFRSRYPGQFVNLVRIPADGRFNP